MRKSLQPFSRNVGRETRPVRHRGPSARVAFALAAALGIASPAHAQNPGLAQAVDLVESLLLDHGDRFENGRSPVLNEAKTANLYFVDGLIPDGFQADAGFDPLYNAQDAAIDRLAVMPDPDTPILRGAAQVRVSFDNFGQRQSFIYTLVKVPPHNDWQISDIYSLNDDWSLTDLPGIGTPAPTANDVTLYHQDPTQTAGTYAPPTGNSNEDNGMEAGDNAAHGPGSDLLFILDGSGSMWGQIDGEAKIVTAKRALSGLIGDLPPGTNIGLMAYGHRRKGDCGDIEVLFPVANHDPATVQQRIETLSPRGKTPIAGALRAAMSALTGSGQRADVLLISDGLEVCGGDPCAAAAELSDAGINTRVHVVGFDLSKEEHAALQCIAEQGKGRYFSANSTDEFLDAVTRAFAATQTEPAPEPEAAAVSAGPEGAGAPAIEVVFEERFEGPDIDPGFDVVNAAPYLSELDGEGGLFVAALGKNTQYDNPKAANRYVLDTELPEGDFDLRLDLKVDIQSEREGVWVSAFEDAGNQITATLWVWSAGCGRTLNLSLTRLSTPDGDKPQKSEFTEELFKNGPLADRICSEDGRIRGDAVLDVLADKGAILRLKRRGREITAELEMEIPGDADAPAEIVTIETEAITALRLSGRPSFLVGQYKSAGERESLFWIDRFAIERPREGD